MAKHLKKIVLTGACGTLGMELRETLAALAERLVSVDIANAPQTLLDNETFIQADCAVLDDLVAILSGADMVVHFAAIADERPFDELLGPNFLASYNIWEAGFRGGVRRIVYASSVHAVGMHETAAGIDLDAPHAPDTFYGLAKCFTEDLGKLYWEKCGLESVHLRIFSCTKVPENVRALRTWLSFDDLRHLVERAVLAPTTGFAVVFGVSNNDQAPVTNSKAGFLGYKPKDNAENWAETLLAGASPGDPSDRAQMLLGGPFATVPLGESGLAGIKAMNAPNNDTIEKDEPAEPAQDAPEKAARKPGQKLPSFLTKRSMNP